MRKRAAIYLEGGSPKSWRKESDKFFLVGEKEKKMKEKKKRGFEKRYRQHALRGGREMKNFSLPW